MLATLAGSTMSKILKTVTDAAATVVAATTYTFRRVHPGGGLLGRTAYTTGAKGIAIFDTLLLPESHRNSVGATLTLIPATIAVPGHTLYYKAYMVACNRHTYHVPGVSGVVTFHATQMPNGSIVDDVASPMLVCNVALRQPGVDAKVRTTTAAINADANLTAAVGKGTAIATPKGVATAAAAAMPPALSK